MFISVEILGATYVWVHVRFHATRHIVRKRNKFVRSNVRAGFAVNESRDGCLPNPSNSNDDNVSFYPIHIWTCCIVYTCILGVVFEVSRMPHRSSNLKAYGVRSRQYFFTLFFKFSKIFVSQMNWKENRMTNFSHTERVYLIKCKMLVVLSLRSNQPSINTRRFYTFKISNLLNTC